MSIPESKIFAGISPNKVKKLDFYFEETETVCCSSLFMIQAFE